MASNNMNGKPEDRASGLPILYHRPTILDAVRHLKSSIIPKIDYTYAREVNCLPLNAIEFIEACKSYPIVFTASESVMPVAIVGMERSNYFVRSDNSWEENVYVPAYVRQYPFIFFENATDKKFYLCVDEASANFSAGDIEGANRLYTDSGDVSEYTKKIMEFCNGFYQHHQLTRNFCHDLVTYKLLQPYHSELVLASGRKTQLSGFQMIDEAAFNALSNKQYLVLRDKGWLPFIYLALASTSNWKNLSVFEARNIKN